MIDIGRRSNYGNPYPLGQVCRRCGKQHDAPGSTLQCFEEYARERLRMEPWWLDPLMTTEGLWCPGCGVDAPTCHGRILEKLRDGE